MNSCFEMKKKKEIITTYDCSRYVNSIQLLKHKRDKTITNYVKCRLILILILLSIIVLKSPE